MQHKELLGLNPGLTAKQFEAFRKVLAETQKNNFSQYSSVVQPFLLSPSERTSAYQIPIPTETKKRYIHETFQLMKPQDIGISEAQFKTLEKNLMALTMEPSELKAVRARLSNTFEEIQNNPNLLAPHLKLPQAQLNEIVNALKPHFNKALWQLSQDTPEHEKRWLGYQQFDYTIGKFIDKLPASALPKSKEQIEGLKQGLYTVMIQPALEHYKRMAAILIAMPGDPTFYMPDLYGQAGGENFKNMYLGNRELIRYDWLEKNPILKKYHDELASIVRLRKEHHALNNGQLILPLDPETNPKAAKILDSTGIIPLMRDDGLGNQTISLLNTGKPEHAWDTYNHASTQGKYPEAKTTQHDYKNYKLDLSAIKIAPGTRYKSVDSETNKPEYFIVDPQMQLVSENDLSKGIDIKIHRLLTREDKRSTRFDNQLPKALLDAMHQAEAEKQLQLSANPFKQATK